MIRFVARFLGLWLIAGALVALVVDGAKTVAASALTTTSIDETWAYAGPEGRAAAEKWIKAEVEPTVGTWLWDPALRTVLAVPTFAVLGVAGGLLGWAGRKRRLSLAYA